MAKFTVVCPKCSKSYRIDEGQLGRKARCKGCDTPFVLEKTREASSHSVLSADAFAQADGPRRRGPGGV